MSRLRNGNFSPAAPSALCGEVVAFDPENPKILFAGCETKGFFRGNDGGKTWKLIGAAGERITAVIVHPWGRGQANQAYLHVVTCPDVWMPVLGRGKPVLAAATALSRDYVSKDGGNSLQMVCERTDLGYLNVAFDRQNVAEFPYGTTHGILKSYYEGSTSFILTASKNLECLRPVTALASSGINNEGLRGRCLSQPLDPATPGQFTRSDFCSFDWQLLPQGGDRPAGGLISVCGEIRQGKQWWLLATDGLYHSLDGGVTLKKVMSEKGTP